MLVTWGPEFRAISDFKLIYKIQIKKHFLNDVCSPVQSVWSCYDAENLWVLQAEQEALYGPLVPDFLFFENVDYPL